MSLTYNLSDSNLKTLTPTENAESSKPTIEIEANCKEPRDFRGRGDEYLSIPKAEQSL